MQYGNGLPGLTADRYMNFSSAPALDKKIYDGRERPHAVEAQRVDRDRLRVGDKWGSAS
jgi:hypothetical protein